ncbi:MAG: hypothetical protein ACLUD2_15105 [Clostridium sp.]
MADSIADHIVLRETPEEYRMKTRPGAACAEGHLPDPAVSAADFYARNNRWRKYSSQKTAAAIRLSRERGADGTVKAGARKNRVSRGAGSKPDAGGESQRTGSKAGAGGESQRAGSKAGAGGESQRAEKQSRCRSRKPGACGSAGSLEEKLLEPRIQQAATG